MQNWPSNFQFFSFQSSNFQFCHFSLLTFNCCQFGISLNSNYVLLLIELKLRHFCFFKKIKNKFQNLKKIKKKKKRRKHLCDKNPVRNYNQYR